MYLRVFACVVLRVRCVDCTWRHSLRRVVVVRTGGTRRGRVVVELGRHVHEAAEGGGDELGVARGERGHA
jgi:hypothetical protein